MRREFYACLTKRADALFELADAVLCADGPVRSLVELSLVGEHRRGHGSLYAALARGRLDVARLRTALSAVALPRAADGRLVLAVDITCWLRPDAHTSPERILCHTYGRGKDQHIMVPGWPYSFVVALETGRSSWTAPLDAVRLAPGDDAATVTATQLRDVVARLIAAGHWSAGDPEILIVADAGYDAPRLAWLMRDLPVQVLARMRSDRVRSWDRLHPRLTRRAGWMGSADLPLIEGTVIRLDVARLPSGAIPKPVWLWWSGTGATPAQADLLWQAFLRRFDIEHTFRLFKQTLGWTCPKVRTPQAADRWTWMLLAVYTQLRLARHLAADLRRPWEKPARAERLSPARVRRGFRHLRGKTPCPANAPKPCQPGPGRPPGRRNTKPTPRHDVHIMTTATSTKTNTNKPTKKKSINPRPRRTG